MIGVDSRGSWSNATRDASRTLIKEIGPEILSLRRLNTKRRLFDFCIFGFLWGVGILLVFVSDSAFNLLRYGGLAVGIILSAIALNACVLMLHEGMHQLLFKTPLLNYWCSVLLGAAVGVSFSAYRILHIFHHVNLGGQDDPDNYRAYTSNRRLEWLMQYGRLLVGSFVYLFFIPFLGWRKETHEGRRKIAIEYVVVVGLISALFFYFPNPLVLYCWFIPLILVAYFTAVRGLSEHSFTDIKDPVTASRTVTSGPIAEFCLLGANYHLAHHLFPEIPSYNLRKLHQLILPRLSRTVVAKSYLSFLIAFVKATRTFNESSIGLVEF